MGNYGMFLIMGNAGFVSATALTPKPLNFKPLNLKPLKP